MIIIIILYDHEQVLSHRKQMDLLSFSLEGKLEVDAFHGLSLVPFTN